MTFLGPCWSCILLLWRIADFYSSFVCNWNEWSCVFKCSFVAVIQSSYYLIRNLKLANVSLGWPLTGERKRQMNSHIVKINRENKLSGPTMATVDMRDEIKSFTFEIYSSREVEFLLSLCEGANIEIRWEHDSFAETLSETKLGIFRFLSKKRRNSFCRDNRNAVLHQTWHEIDNWRD